MATLDQMRKTAGTSVSAQQQEKSMELTTVGDAQNVVQYETASSAAAARARALVEAHYVMAFRHKRVWDEVRQKIRDECLRPAFARNKSAWYVKPIGDGAEGLGIRFVEVALRCMRNVAVDTALVFEDQEKEVWSVSVTDLESTLPYTLEVRVSKTVERRKPMDDGSYISKRKNSYGKDTYTVPANDDDLLNKRAAIISKAIRTQGLRIIPGDLQDEAEAIIKKVRLDDAAADPAGTRKEIIDAFHDLNVKVTDLTEFVGHALDTCSPAELNKLRGIYGAIRDGEATWAQVVENEAERRSNDTKQPPADKSPDKSTKATAGAQAQGAGSGISAPESPAPSTERPKTAEDVIRMTAPGVADALFGNLD